MHAHRVAQAGPGRAVRQQPRRQFGHQPQRRGVGYRGRQPGGTADVVVVGPQLERPDDQQRAHGQPHAVQRHLGAEARQGADQREGTVGGPAPRGPGLLRRHARLAGGPGLGGADMVGIGDGRIAGQGAAHVPLDAGQMADQVLDIQAAQDGNPPGRVVQRAQHPVQRVGRSAVRLHRGDLRNVGNRPPGRPHPPGSLEHPGPQALGQHGRFPLGGRHDNSSNCRSSIVSSLARASRNRDLAVPSGMPAATATSR